MECDCEPCPWTRRVLGAGTHTSSCAQSLAGGLSPHAVRQGISGTERSRRDRAFLPRPHLQSMATLGGGMRPDRTGRERSSAWPPTLLTRAGQPDPHTGAWEFPGDHG